MFSGSAQTRSNPLAAGSAEALTGKPERIASVAQATAADRTRFHRGFVAIVRLLGSLLSDLILGTLKRREITSHRSRTGAYNMAIGFRRRQSSVSLTSLKRASEPRSHQFSAAHLAMFSTRSYPVG
jgi:hypothetical protein